MRGDAKQAAIKIISLKKRHSHQYVHSNVLGILSKLCSKSKNKNCFRKSTKSTFIVMVNRLREYTFIIVHHGVTSRNAMYIITIAIYVSAINWKPLSILFFVEKQTQKMR